MYGAIWNVWSNKYNVNGHHPAGLRATLFVLGWKHLKVLSKFVEQSQGASQYRDVVLPVKNPHVKDKTVSRPSYL